MTCAASVHAADGAERDRRHRHVAELPYQRLLHGLRGCGSWCAVGPPLPQRVLCSLTSTATAATDYDGMSFQLSPRRGGAFADVKMVNGSFVATVADSSTGFRALTYLTPCYHSMVTAGNTTGACAAHALAKRAHVLMRVAAVGCEIRPRNCAPIASGYQLLANGTAADRVSPSDWDGTLTAVGSRRWRLAPAASNATEYILWADSVRRRPARMCLC